MRFARRVSRSAGLQQTRPSANLPSTIPTFCALRLQALKAEQARQKRLMERAATDLGRDDKGIPINVRRPQGEDAVYLHKDFELLLKPVCRPLEKTPVLSFACCWT